MHKYVWTVLLIVTSLGTIYASPVDTYIAQQITNIIPNITAPEIEAVQWHFTNLLSSVPESRWTETYTRKMEKAVAFQLKILAASRQKPGDLIALRQVDPAPLKKTLSAPDLSSDQSAKLHEQIDRLFDEIGNQLEKALKTSRQVEIIDEYKSDAFAKFMGAVGSQMPEKGFFENIHSGTSEIVSNYLSRASTDYVATCIQYIVANARSEYNSVVDNPFQTGNFLVLDEQQFEQILGRVKADMVSAYSKQPFSFSWRSMAKNIESCGRQLTTESKSYQISISPLAAKGVIFANYNFNAETNSTEFKAAR